MRNGTTSARRLSLPASPELGPMKPSKPIWQACRKAALSVESRHLPNAPTAIIRAAGFRPARSTHSGRSEREAQGHIRSASQADSTHGFGTLEMDCKSTSPTASEHPPPPRTASRTSRISFSVAGSPEAADPAAIACITATTRTSTGASRPNHSLNAERSTFRRFAAGAPSPASPARTSNASSPSALLCLTRDLSSAVLLASTCPCRSIISPSTPRKSGLRVVNAAATPKIRACSGAVVPPRRAARNDRARIGGRFPRSVCAALAAANGFCVASRTICTKKATVFAFTASSHNGNSYSSKMPAAVRYSLTVVTSARAAWTLLPASQLALARSAISKHAKCALDGSDVNPA
mmetsp:Transcript_11828/g.25520  ORF Transcript_11828/g.25520 Transcript_11828/m.25520 type:complete len:350 (-) Transcript_11828:754-1803(-)